MRYYIALIALLYSICSTTVQAEEQDTSTASSRVLDIIAQDFATAGSDALGYILAPLSFDERDWFYTIGLVGVTASAIAADEQTSPWFRKQASPLNDDIASVVKQYGEAKYATAFALSVYASGLIAGDDEVRITGRLLCESLLLAGVTSQSIKMLAGRSRPYRDDGVWHFDPLQSSDNSRLSLPSGHTTVAFAVSSVLAARIDNSWATVGLYSLASLTALSRIYHGEHWLSDTILGAVIGTAAGLTVTSYERARDNKTESSSFVLLPTGQGITIVYRL